MGLCCVVPAFARSSDFAIDKPAGVPCPNLTADLDCGIHAELRERGFPGCTVYDCFGAGQRVVAAYDASDRRAPIEVRRRMFADFEVVERLHELLWYLADARSRPAAARLRAEIEGLTERVERAAEHPGEVEVERLQARADVLLDEVSGLVRAHTGGPDLRSHDLAGRDLSGQDLVGARLRGATLLGADLHGCDLTDADLLGADLRGADLAGADLRTALFLTVLQVGSARGDAGTRLPEVVPRPAHWR